MYITILGWTHLYTATDIHTHICIYTNITLIGVPLPVFIISIFLHTSRKYLGMKVENNFFTFQVIMIKIIWIP